VANGENKISDWKECLVTLMEKSSQQPLQWTFISTQSEYGYVDKSEQIWVCVLNMIYLDWSEYCFYCNKSKFMYPVSIPFQKSAICTFSYFSLNKVIVFLHMLTRLW
jgi:hypothetical protein